MSFRFRVLGLVMLVAVSATAVTAWLILRGATQQINEPDSAASAQLDEIAYQLSDYGLRHGTWEGVSNLVVGLGRQTGQRIHLITENGEVIVDTDHEANPTRQVRAIGAVNAPINPRPSLDLTGVDQGAAAITLKRIQTYRADVRLAACLTRRGVDVVLTPASYGVPGVQADTATAGSSPIVGSCSGYPREPAAALEEDRRRVGECVVAVDTEPDHDCLAQVFADRIDEVAPKRAQVYVGVGGRSLVIGPLLAAAAGVAAVTIIVTALLSHRVLRPIGTLTAASQRLGRGDLTSRVPVDGNDELATLARSFNRMADSLQRGEERQRRLVADVAHELRTPLANLRGYLEALSDGVIDPDPELFASLHEEAVLQQRIVDDLQDLALAEAGSLAYHRTVVDLAELLETCRTAHRAGADAAGVTLTVSAGPLPPVYVDPDRMRQVLGNLVTNALRATGRGGTITLGAEHSGDSAVLRVADTGSGIAPEALPHVFDRFWRADSARGRKTGGSGLGLAIVRQIVTDHGGVIRVASELGVGTTFTITLPVAPAVRRH
ncbi:ATP-binding protein [Plantactinospora sp. B24E8]|uniref:sensor histidine kinase n=1 Tax=Plantactinospora sp. B24E8 TaxID=3153567 RepID=UPI00325F5FFD